VTVTADFSYVVNGLEVTCTDISTVSPPSSEIISWFYSASIPGPNIYAEGQNQTLFFPVPGTYIVDLDVETIDEWAGVSKTITVVANICFSAYVKNSDDTLSIVFTDLSAPGAISWLWDFGDGNTSVEQHPSYTYGAAGTYTVSLTIDGQSYVRTLIVTSPVQKVLALTNDGHILKSMDKGLTWADQGQKIPPYDLATHGLDVACGIVNLDGGVIIAYSGYESIQRSTDFGETWSTITIPYFSNHAHVARSGYSLGMGRGLLGGFRFDPTCNNMLLGSILLTLDYGLTWNRVTLSGNVDTYLDFSSFGNNRYILALRGKLFGACGPASYSEALLSVSVNQGGIWSNISGPGVGYSLDAPNSLMTTMLPEGQAVIPRSQTSLTTYEPPYQVFSQSIDPNKVYDKIFWSASGKLFAGSGDYEDVMEFTPRATGDFTRGTAIAYGNGIFVAVGFDDIVLLSLDGLTWDSTNLLPNIRWYSIAYGAGVFVAGGTYGLAASMDGISWTTVLEGYGFGRGTIVYGNGIFVANSYNTISTSSDGYTWVTDPSEGAGIPFGNDIGSLAYGGGKFVTLGSKTAYPYDTVPLTSVNGLDWTVFSVVKNFGYTPPITYGNGLFVALSTDNDGFSEDLETIMISADGENWTLQKAPETNSWHWVFYGNGLFVGLASYKTHSIMTSPNGIDWTIRSQGSAYKYGGVYGEGVYAIILDTTGVFQHYILTSPGPVPISDPVPTLYSSSDRGATFDAVLENYETWAFNEIIDYGEVVAAEFYAIPLSGSSPLTVQFTDESTGATSWDWDFGDGSAHGTTQNPSHIYSVTGTYSVVLSINSGESSKTRTNYITVTSSTVLLADFQATPLTGDAPLMVQFTDTSTGGPTGWNWNFGDGFTATTQNPSHRYSFPGAYTVRLTVSNLSASDTLIRTAYVTVRITGSGFKRPNGPSVIFD